VIAIRTAVITREEARQSYLLSEEELSAWEIALDKKGIPGLRSGVRQSYGPAPARVEAAPVSHEIG
jgi:PHD/YefM family antitoxin component YafN of YafNO toxin-antitoxin module